MWAEPILHVDMDSFFVEVERLRDPALRGRAVAVGGTGSRGVIASASYEARAFGVHSAQPTSTARRMCRDLIVVSPAHGRYGEMSGRVFDIFRSFTPYVEGLSLDEAFLDVTGLRRHYGSVMEVATAIRARIRDDLGLPASVGVAATKFVAKLASKVAKPDGQRLVSAGEQLEFIHALPITAMWGVGPATNAALERLGVVIVGDLTEIPETAVLSALGPTQGRHLLALASGIDPRPVEPDTETRSVSVEETYDEDLVGRDVIEAALLAHAQRLAGRLRRSGVSARTITVKVRDPGFTTMTRSHTVDGALRTPRELFDVGRSLLDQIDLSRPVRLLGLGGSSLVETGEPSQMSLDADDGWHRVADAVAGVRERYGEHSVEPARLIDPRSTEPGKDQ